MTFTPPERIRGPLKERLDSSPIKRNESVPRSGPAPSAVSPLRHRKRRRAIAYLRILSEESLSGSYIVGNEVTSHWLSASRDLACF
ncbi:hypothetical protein AVEN_243974-1 [Araneus ventricosus]|uniref:Uncharacterized protein n=1 Tax=Araneus ventricosus TaxID=182803 RepID=A0A4Y2N4C5_ARAVE|nr:hypothetical protein AVEN_243974-1 [Araneus ventricosus]